MAFLIFQKETRDGKVFYRNLHEQYKLAGYGLIRKLWMKKGSLLNHGYSLTANDLLVEHSEIYSGITHSLVIDFHPSSRERIGLIEIENIHLYTYSDGVNNKAGWTPMMLELKDVFYDDYDDLTQEDKEKIIANFEVSDNQRRLIEFLYLNGESRSWNWGRNGTTNACFIHEESKNYFIKFFK